MVLSLRHGRLDPAGEISSEVKDVEFQVESVRLLYGVLEITHGDDKQVVYFVKKQDCYYYDGGWYGCVYFDNPDGIGTTFRPELTYVPYD